METSFIGVDVGTGSVRVGLFTSTGTLRSVVEKGIEINSPEPGYYEQSSDEIWTVVCQLIKDLVEKNPLADIKSLAFCGTCSLVAIGKDDEPVSTSKSGNPKWNIVMWMDHRADAEAALINSMNHPMLSTVGGKISLEMQIPKILWLHDNLRQSYNLTTTYYDLCDFLRWKATGLQTRSVCALVSKWNFLYEPEGRCQFETTFLSQFGLGSDDTLRKFQAGVSFPRDSDTLLANVAETTGLKETTTVGFSMVDAHAGLLGLIGCNAGGDPSIDSGFTSRVALICGTSNCVMVLNRKPIQIRGVWGPYYGGVLEQFYVAEGGQSAAGKLVDHVVTSHPAYTSLLTECGTESGVFACLEGILIKLGAGSSSVEKLEVAYLTKELHVWPDFHGNRSPVADSTLKGMVSGLSLATCRTDLALLYLATLQALAYGIRFIKDELLSAGYSFTDLVICGGMAKSPLFLTSLADSLGMDVIVPRCAEAVLLGAAISAASGYFKGIGTQESIVVKMSGTGIRVRPNCETKTYHDKKYAVFLRMLSDQQAYRRLMAD